MQLFMHELIFDDISGCKLLVKQNQAAYKALVIFLVMPFSFLPEMSLEHAKIQFV